MDREKAAKELLEQVKHNDTKNIELNLKNGRITLEIIRYELFIPSLLEHTLQENKLAFKLLQCEINSMSSFHFAAMLGHFNILVGFLDKNAAADMPLESGTTALHLASFGGHMPTIKLLLNVYKADVNRVDRYGWTALHYASTEGHLHVIKLLIQFGADINKRDKDGTCAALRAQWQGHADVVSYFCNIGEEDELLNILEGESGDKIEPPYATVQKKTKAEETKTNHAERSASFSIEPNNNTPLTKRQESSPAAPVTRRHSDAAGGSGMASGMSKSATLPTKFKEARNSRIRRVIRKELESAFSDYANPIDVVGASGAKSDESEILMAGVGVQTMTRLMREEIQKYRNEMINQERPHFSAGAAIKEEYHEEENDDYESLYDTIKGFGQAPSAPGQKASGGSGAGVYDMYVPPPLPPRNLDDHPDNQPEEEEDEVDKMMKSMSIKGQPSSEALNAAIRKLGSIVGGDWKKLARNLPLDKNVSKVEERIKAIERQHLGNTEKQALQALLDWRLMKGKEAEVDALIIAMRKAGLRDKIEAIEIAAYEFTA